ncbi:MAG: acdA [Firmicutes bacterium]|nr:acdA [Bacillota bacterium]
MFDMSLTEEQMILQQNVREFVQKKITPVANKYDQSGEFPWEVINELIAMDLHCMPVPVEYGGPGLDAVSCALLAEELGKGDAGIATTIAANGLTSYPVMLAGTPEQKKMYFDILMQGKLAGFCLTEPNAGSDAGGVMTTAVREGDEYVLNGTKCFITNGGVADVYTVFANVDIKKGIRGLSAFIVERSREGVQVGQEEDKMGIRTSNTTEVIFKNVRVPADHLLGREGEGFKIAMQTLDVARPMVGAISVGLAQSALDLAINYSKERRQFGKPIASLQAIQFMLADMAIQIEAARSMVYRACYLIDAKKPHGKEAAIAKVFASDMAMQVTTDAVQVFGGYGYSRQYPVEKLMRDAKIMQIFEGTNQIQRVVIAGQILR